MINFNSFWSILVLFVLIAIWILLLGSIVTFYVSNINNIHYNVKHFIINKIIVFFFLVLSFFALKATFNAMPDTDNYILEDKPYSVRTIYKYPSTNSYVKEYEDYYGYIYKSNSGYVEKKVPKHQVAIIYVKDEDDIKVEWYKS